MHFATQDAVASRAGKANLNSSLSGFLVDPKLRPSAQAARLMFFNCVRYAKGSCESRALFGGRLSSQVVTFPLHQLGWARIPPPGGEGGPAKRGRVGDAGRSALMCAVSRENPTRRAIARHS